MILENNLFKEAFTHPILQSLALSLSRSLALSLSHSLAQGMVFIHISDEKGKSQLEETGIIHILDL
jgi:hypothetical protein